MTSLQTCFERAFATRRADYWTRQPAPSFDLGVETRRDPAAYRWSGLHRGENRRRPRLLFQATLAGWGRYEENGQSWEVGPGHAFLTLLPSAHVYHLPPQSPGWTFAWMIVDHPHVVARAAALRTAIPPVFPLSGDSELMATTLELFERMCARAFEDALAEEAALLGWMITLLRHGHDLAHPRDRRAAMLADLRAYTRRHLARSFGIEEVARSEGLSRSHYSHRFRAATGLAPAACVLEVRLHEVRRRLCESAAPLKDIAAATGFADANHLCKAFRRRFHVSPGAYRRQGGRKLGATDR